MTQAERTLLIEIAKLEIRRCSLCREGVMTVVNTIDPETPNIRTIPCPHCSDLRKAVEIVEKMVG